MQKNISLRDKNSWKVGGVADFFDQPKTLEQLLALLKWAKNHACSVTFLSGASNVLISDQGVKGLVISFKNLNLLKSFTDSKKLYIQAEAGVKKSNIMRIFAKYKLAPALFLCGLPGDVAGGIVMNAGAGKTLYPKEFKDIVDWVKVVKNGELCCLKKKDINWQYRDSQGWQPGPIYSAGLSWPLKPLPDFDLQLKEVALQRARSQPLQSASAGSVFKNPTDGQKGAGALIEACGLKGYQIGKASISEKHANFILNKGGAKAMDIHKLIKHTKKMVLEKQKVQLELEVKYMGRW